MSDDTDSLSDIFDTDDIFEEIVDDWSPDPRLLKLLSELLE